MRSIKNIIVGLAIATLLSTGAFAGANLNEVGAFLVYPTIVAFPGLLGIETLVTITNAGPDSVIAHVSYINGNQYDEYQYCYECDFEIPLSGNDTETLVITTSEGGGHSSGGGSTRIQAEDLYLDLSCPWNVGMLVVSLEDEDGNTISDNVLLGEEVVLDYLGGRAFSIPAIPFQGSSNDGNREFSFDDEEYARMPRVVAADFLAPAVGGSGKAGLNLFTLGFERQFPPLVDCSVIGYDANEHPFSGSFQFGCWTWFDLCDISPEFCYPNLGLFNNDPHHPVSDTHGWLQLNCRVDTNPGAADGFEIDGGVHGAIVQEQWIFSQLAAGSGAPFIGNAWWGRLLYQSVTTGDALTLVLEEDALGMD